MGAACQCEQATTGAEEIVLATPGTNSAFIFIKPHACTEKVKSLAQQGLEAQGIKILKQGSITADVIDKKKLIDQHYYAIASKATILKPSELNVPTEKFKAAFGIDWQEALDSGKVFNAMDACGKLGIDAAELNKYWGKAKDANQLVKFGGGFYCGKVTVDGKDPLYIFNAFFMAMREKFTRKGAEIHYYVVEWDPLTLPWADFRGKVLGPTDPANAPKDSLRGKILADWEGLGLSAPPNVGDNGMHASASPFEGFAERCNWLGYQTSEDSFGRQALAQGMPEKLLKEWSVDPQIMITQGEKGSVFDALEDKDTKECLAKLVEFSKLA